MFIKVHPVSGGLPKNTTINSEELARYSQVQIGTNLFFHGGAVLSVSEPIEFFDDLLSARTHQHQPALPTGT